jgi:hypothetical protein
MLTEKISEFTKSELGKFIEKTLPYYPIPNTDLAVDISLVTVPKIESDFIIFNLNGAIVNQKIPSTLNPPFEIPENLLNYDKFGKKLQVFLTDYALNSALYTLQQSDLLEYTIKPEQIQDNKFGLKLDTTFIDFILNGFSNIYGKDRLALINCKASTNTKVALTADNIDLLINAECSIFVKKDLEYDQAITFGTTILTNVNAEVNENGTIKACINSLSIMNSKIIESKVPDANIVNIEFLVNSFVTIALPIINEKYLKEIHVDIPHFNGLVFDESFAKIAGNYVKVEVTPAFEATSGKSLFGTLMTSFKSLK